METEDELEEKLNKIVQKLRKSSPEAEELWQTLERIRTSKAPLRIPVKDPLEDFLKHRHRF